jgi:hypothetical protein
MNKVFGIKNCDTMKKAFAWLEANGVAYEFSDYKKAGVAEAHGQKGSDPFQTHASPPDRPARAAQGSRNSSLPETRQ